MPTSMLFATNNEGHVFGLPSNGTKWREFPFSGIDFKHISAAPHYLWAIGSDRQVYLHVHGLDTTIRVREESFENQRWLPMEGFTNRLLPTDRFAFSSEDGLTERRKDKIRVPSLAWKWDGDWKIETTLNNEPLDQDGWTYAVDFPATYYGSKKWNSCVRRRKWIRYRRYIAVNSWCSIAPLHTDPTQEPFRSISVGGHQMAGLPPGSLQVWATTVNGRVMWRKDVSVMCPEGTMWNEIPLLNNIEVKQVSCGSDDKVWAVTMCGKALVRDGIMAGEPTGNKWIGVEPPFEDLKIMEISVGRDAVWALTEEYKVWFRKGTTSSNPTGLGWVQMVGEMASISVSPTDQVVGVSYVDRNVFIRMGVNEGELTGKKWKLINSMIHGSRGSSIANPRSIVSDGSDSKCDYKDDIIESSSSRSVPTFLDLKSSWLKPVQPSSLPIMTEGFIEEAAHDNRSFKGDIDTKGKLFAWSPVRSVGSVLGFEASVDTDIHADWDGEVFIERESMCEPGWNQFVTLWATVAAGALYIDSSNLPNWFFDSGYNNCLASSLWRSQILRDLQNNNNIFKNGYENFEPAVEKSSCRKSVECRFSVLDNLIEDCFLELEFTCNQKNTVQSGCLTLMTPSQSYTKYQILLNEICCVSSCSEPGSPRLALHTVHSSLSQTVDPLVLHFTRDVDFDEWQAQITSVICDLHGLEGSPGPLSLWATTTLGDVFVFDPFLIQSRQIQDGYYTCDLAISNKAVPWKNFLANGFLPGMSVTVVGFIPYECDSFSVNLECSSNSKIALHVKPKFQEKVVVRNSKENDIWNDNEEKSGVMPLKRGSNCSVEIVCEKEGFKILFDRVSFAYFDHRMRPEMISHLTVNGMFSIDKVICKSNKITIDCTDLFWRQIGGHLVKVETCSSGVVWGISANNTLWAYSGGWGGHFLSGLEKSSYGLNSMVDNYKFFIYENQRWNPLSGYSSRGLPTDRPMWSDSTGRIKKSKDTTRLLNMHWQWVSDWTVDFNTPGGTDTEGWQYATDFPASYHARKTITDYVRRRRWTRECKLFTYGPWIEVGNSKVIDISIQQWPVIEMVSIWAVGINGEALFRRGVSSSDPIGECWDHIECDQPLMSISCGFSNQVWAISQKGFTLWRFGITTSNPIGSVWESVENPKGKKLKKVSVSKMSAWVIDTNGNLHVRHEVSPVFPEGSHWQSLESTDSFHDVSAAENEVWAVTTTGVICRRVGVSTENPAGIFWDHRINAGWSSISCRGLVFKS